MNKACEYQAHQVVFVSEKVYEVESEGNARIKYKVSLGDENRLPYCECEDFRRMFLPCKHFFAIFLHSNSHSWNDVCEEYRESPYLKLDTSFMSQVSQTLLSQQQEASECGSLTGRDASDMANLIQCDTPPSDPQRPSKKQSNKNILHIKDLKKKQSALILRVKQVESSIYDCVDVEVLTGLAPIMEQAYRLLQQATLHEGGLAIHQQPLSTAQVRSLQPRRKGRVKNPLTGRVGSQAESGRKAQEEATNASSKLLFLSKRRN